LNVVIFGGSSYQKAFKKAFTKAFLNANLPTRIQRKGIEMDLVDEIMEDWSKQRADIDCSGKAIICRTLRTHSYYISLLDKALKAVDMAPNVFSVLVTIRRKGETAEINVKKIIDEVLFTSGAMSNLLKRLVNKGYISKRQDDNDARSVLVKLTPSGLRLIDKAMEIQAACERKITNELTVNERKQLSELLRKIQPERF